MIGSTLEHQIPEMLFTTEEHPGEAVSAIKALAKASIEGQRIYQITQENVNTVLPQLNVSTDVKNEIRASVAVGKVATVSQNNITVGSWTGVGYIITDPETGAGAYMISAWNRLCFLYRCSWAKKTKASFIWIKGKRKTFFSNYLGYMGCYPPGFLVSFFLIVTDFGDALILWFFCRSIADEFGKQMWLLKLLIPDSKNNCLLKTIFYI